MEGYECLSTTHLQLRALATLPEDCRAIFSAHSFYFLRNSWKLFAWPKEFTTLPKAMGVASLRLWLVSLSCHVRSSNYSSCGQMFILNCCSPLASWWSLQRPLWMEGCCKIWFCDSFSSCLPLISVLWPQVRGNAPCTPLELYRWEGSFQIVWP